MRIDKLFRPYIKGTKSPITTKWYRTSEEAEEWGKTFANNRYGVEIKSKEINDILKNRKRMGFRGLL